MTSTPRSLVSATPGGGSSRVVAKREYPGDLQKPALSLRKQEILTEDEYTEALSSIIKRDFFPNLARLDAENEYLSALEAQDQAWIGRSVMRLVDVEEQAGVLRTPAGGTGTRGASRQGGGQLTERGTPTPWTRPGVTPRDGGQWADTPGGESFVSDFPGAAGTSQPVGRYDANLSLDEFQAKYTSEDNASFAHILQKANEKRRERFSWAYEAERKANERHRKAIESGQQAVAEGRKLIMAAGGEGRERLLIEDAKSADMERGSEKAKGKQKADADDEKVDQEDKDRIATEAEESRGTKEGGMSMALVKTDSDKEDPTFDPEAVLKPKSDRRQRVFDAWRFKARNSFMYPPDANLPPTNMQPASKAMLPSGVGGAGQSGDESQPRGEPKAISHANTRLFEDQDTEGREAPDSPRSSMIEAAIKGTPYNPTSTPRVKGFGFVSALPSPNPEALGADRVRQLMTWGQIEGTPVPIRSSDGDDVSAGARAADYESPFRIPETPRREVLASKLASSAARSLRNRPGSLLAGSPRVQGTPGSAYSPYSRFTPSSSSRNEKDRTGGFSAATMTPRDRTNGAHLSDAARNLLDRTAGLSRLNSGALNSGSPGAGAFGAAGSRKRSSLGSAILSSGGGRGRRELEGVKVRRVSKSGAGEEGLGRLKRERWSPSPSPVPRRGLEDVVDG